MRPPRNAASVRDVNKNKPLGLFFLAIKCLHYPHIKTISILGLNSLMLQLRYGGLGINLEHLPFFNVRPDVAGKGVLHFTPFPSTAAAAQSLK